MITAIFYRQRMFKRIVVVTLCISAICFSGCALSEQYFHYLIGEKGDQLPLFMDDFSDHDNGWKVTVTEHGVVHYDGDSFRILIQEPNVDYWSTPGLSLTDIIMEVDTRKVTGPDNNLYGTTCRWRDRNNYYAFQVSNDGYYGIIKVKDGERIVLSGGQMQTTDLLLKGEKTNHLRADCIGSTLRLYLNWTKLAEVSDTDFTSGDAGLIASTLDESGTDIRFDNFIITQALQVIP